MKRPDGTKPVNLNLRQELLDRAKAEATRRGQTMTVFVARAIEAALPEAGEVAS